MSVHVDFTFHVCSISNVGFGTDTCKWTFKGRYIGLNYFKYEVVGVCLIVRKKITKLINFNYLN